MGSSQGLLHPLWPAGRPLRANFVLLQKPYFHQQLGVMHTHTHTQSDHSLWSRAWENRDLSTKKKKKKVFSQRSSLFCLSSDHVYSTRRLFRCKFQGERLDTWLCLGHRLNHVPWATPGISSTAGFLHHEGMWCGLPEQAFGCVCM